MLLSEKDFQVLDALDRHEITSQRQLADHAGISLGKVNYVLKSLLDKGLVKLGNFQNNPRKIVSYAYLLTPKGIEEKSRLSVRFVINRLKEYDNLRQTFTERLSAIHERGHTRIVIVGSQIISDFLISIINEKHPKIALIGHCNSWKDLNSLDPDSYDLAILFDGSEDGIKAIRDATGVPKDKLTPLW